MKPLLIIGLLASVGALGFQFMIRDSLRKARSEKDGLNRQTVVIHTDTRKVNESITEVFTQHDGVEKNAKNLELETKALAADAKSKEEELGTLKKNIEEINARKTQISEEISRILGTTGTPEEMLARVEALKKENDEKVLEIEQLDKEFEVARKSAVENEQLAARLNQAQASRTKTISLGNRTGVVSAVNPEWAFAVVNMGSNQGVSNESRLLVKRGGQLIGRLNVVQIEANQTVADISIKSLTPGFTIQPGDEVIFENSAS